MMFKQNLKQFISSKSNWKATVMIIGGAYAAFTGLMDYPSAIQMVTGGIAVIGLRDALV